MLPYGGYALTLSGAGAVELYVEAETLGGVGDLHHSRDPLEGDIAPDEVGCLRHHEVDVRLDAPDVLTYQEGSPD